MTTGDATKIFPLADGATPSKEKNTDFLGDVIEINLLIDLHTRLKTRI